MNVIFFALLFITVRFIHYFTLPVLVRHFLKSCIFIPQSPFYALLVISDTNISHTVSHAKQTSALPPSFTACAPPFLLCNERVLCSYASLIHSSTCSSAAQLIHPRTAWLTVRNTPDAPPVPYGAKLCSLGCIFFAPSGHATASHMHRRCNSPTVSLSFFLIQRSSTPKLCSRAACGGVTGVAPRLHMQLVSNSAKRRE